MSFNEEKICEKGKELGFFEVVCFAPSLLNPRDDIREICGNGYCQNFGNNWLCPPAAPSIERCRAILGEYSHAFLLITKKKNIDYATCDFALEAREHNAKIYAFCDLLKRGISEHLMLSTGACELCEKCAYPEKCRLSNRNRESLCAFGIDAGELCAAVGVDYRFVKEELNLVGVVLVK